ncbi:uncharacterized protein LOC123312268 [Coccinella septempunctata]|uniref:uncharacterized protein LOC123312268 n=1 Tax=Coccinella septempunctata TaxID=41139 RepID=UPI001D0782A4|nr:uncharacterized protein LOC123308685 isoform X2 [Coccinella septempunctata]XP_044752544.1 uncharacterized protein LOC123312268 [Coccinella septempunctata]
MAEYKKKCRRYSVDYLKFGFLPSKADKRLPICLLCNKLLSNDSMKPSKLEDHLRRCHPDKVERLDEDIQTYVQHLIALHDDFKIRFEDILTMEIPPWIINPFDETEVGIVILQEELLELSTNEELKVKFKRGYQAFCQKYPKNILDCGELRESF